MLIENKRRNRQIHDFTGIYIVDGGPPGDIDGAFDISGKCFCLFEGKYIGTDLNNGQRKFLENTVKSHSKAGHLAIAIVYEHNVSPEQIVFVAECTVMKIFYKGRWHIPKNKITVVNVIEWFKQVSLKFLTS